MNFLLCSFGLYILNKNRTLLISKPFPNKIYLLPTISIFNVLKSEIRIWYSGNGEELKKRSRTVRILFEEHLKSEDA